MNAIPIGYLILQSRVYTNDNYINAPKLNYSNKKMRKI